MKGRSLVGGLLVLALLGAGGWWMYRAGHLKGLGLMPPGTAFADGQAPVEGAAAGGPATGAAGGPGARRDGTGSAGAAGAGRRMPPGFDPNLPTPVQAAIARRGAIPVTLTALGTVTARNTATVRARVSGLLQKIQFQEGQMVKAGDVLAIIDPAPYQVQVDQAAGQYARDQALLAGARVDLERYRTLQKQDSIASQQVDTQAALVRQYEGTVKADKAALDTARLNLQYTRITAPISGRLGLRQVDLGNMISTTDANGVVLITETQPITVVFSIPSVHLPAVLARLDARQTLQVQAFASDGSTLLATGKLLSVDNQIDTTTGTVKIKALFGNADNKLYPNQFVNARLLVETLEDRVLIPGAAVQRGAQGSFVYKVREGSVSPVVVKVGVTFGDEVSIDEGVSVGDQVVTDGVDRLREGARVTIVTPASAVVTTPDGRLSGGQRRRGDAAHGATGSPDAAGAARGGADGERRRRREGGGTPAR